MRNGFKSSARSKIAHRQAEILAERRGYKIRREEYGRGGHKLYRTGNRRNKIERKLGSEVA